MQYQVKAEIRHGTGRTVKGGHYFYVAVSAVEVNFFELHAVKWM